MATGALSGSRSTYSSASSRRKGYQSSQFSGERDGSDSQGRWAGGEPRGTTQVTARRGGKNYPARWKHDEPRAAVQSAQGRNDAAAWQDCADRGPRTSYTGQQTNALPRLATDDGHTKSTGLWSDVSSQTRAAVVCSETSSRLQQGYGGVVPEPGDTSNAWTGRDEGQSWRHGRGKSGAWVDIEHSSTGLGCSRERQCGNAESREQTLFGSADGNINRGERAGNLQGRNGHDWGPQQTRFRQKEDQFSNTGILRGYANEILPPDRQSIVAARDADLLREGKRSSGLSDAILGSNRGGWKTQMPVSSRGAKHTGVGAKVVSREKPIWEHKSHQEVGVEDFGTQSLRQGSLHSRLGTNNVETLPVVSAECVGRKVGLTGKVTTIPEGQGDVGIRDGSHPNFQQHARGQLGEDRLKTVTMTNSKTSEAAYKERELAQNREIPSELHLGGKAYGCGGRWNEEEDKRSGHVHEQELHKFRDSDGIDGEVPPLIIGLCPDMCPAQEREQRERLRDLSVFERLNGNPSKTSRELAVKKFCRTFSGIHIQPSLVRPFPVLWRTLQYLLNLLDDTEFPFELVQNFLFDRTRAIRQELGMQRLANSQVVTMYEEIVRFHILSEHGFQKRSSAAKDSDSLLNLQQLSKTLMGLFDLYSVVGSGISVNEAEFQSYFVLLNLGDHDQFQVDPLSIWFRHVKPALFNAPEVKFAREVLRSHRMGNFKSYFKLARDATFLQGCLMELHFNEVRIKALMAMNEGGYKLHPIPLRDLASLFLMKEGDVEELCNFCGLSTGMDNAKVRCLLVKQSQFSLPNRDIPSFRCSVIGNNRAPSYYQEVLGRHRRH